MLARGSRIRESNQIQPGTAGCSEDLGHEQWVVSLVRETLSPAFPDDIQHCVRILASILFSVTNTIYIYLQCCMIYMGVNPWEGTAHINHFTILNQASTSHDWSISLYPHVCCLQTMFAAYKPYLLLKKLHNFNDFMKRRIICSEASTPDSLPVQWSRPFQSSQAPRREWPMVCYRSSPQDETVFVCICNVEIQVLALWMKLSHFAKQYVNYICVS